MSAKRIEVDLTHSQISVFQGGEVVHRMTEFSIGREHHRTPLIRHGSLSLTKRFRSHKSSIYHAQMPYSLFFEHHPSCAFHSGDVNTASHGCVHLKLEDAQWLYTWAGHDAVGLSFIGSYPHSPIRKGH